LRPAASIALALAFSSFSSLGCTINATSLDFGSINPLIAGDATSTSTITVTCTALTSYSIALSAGGGGSFVERVMRSGANTLYYQLYSDVANTTIWGDGTGGSTVFAGSASGAGTTSNVYGRVPHQQSAFAGTYADSIVVTVTY